MSVSSISGPASTGSAYQPNSSSQKDIRDSFKQMADAIQSGDLGGAQNAYAGLAQLLDANPQSTPLNSGQGSTSSQDGSDTNSLSALLGQIGDSLQSGDLSGAQQTLQTLQQAMQGRHHRHHGGAAANGQASQTAPSSSPSAGTAAPDPASSPASGVDLTV
jgi:hypothetical protein